MQDKNGWFVHDPNLLKLCRNSQHLFPGTVFKRPFHPVPPSSTSCMQCLRTVMHATRNGSLAVVCDGAPALLRDKRNTGCFFFVVPFLCCEIRHPGEEWSSC